MNSKLKSAIINIVLFAVVVFLGIKLVQSILAPINFGKEKAAREVLVVQRLKDLRDLELQYKQAHNKFTASYDTLLAFGETSMIPIVKIIPDPTDTTFTKTINDTLGYVKVIDSLFGNRQNFDIHELKMVPFSEPAEQFEIQAGSIKRGGVNVSVFEIKTPYEVYLNGLEEQRVLNVKAEQEQIDKYPGLRVGSMEEATTDGNWEKL
jgi:hypothetical protein